MDTVAQRLNRLEGENRWWKVVGIVSVAILGLVVFTGAKGSNVADEVNAKAFNVVDSKGKTRIQLAVNEAGSPGVRLVDENEEIRASLGLLPDGVPGLLLFNRNGKGIVELQGKEDEGSIILSDIYGISRIKISIGKHGNPGLVFNDKKEDVRIALALLEDSPVIILTNNEGKVIWEAP